MLRYTTSWGASTEIFANGVMDRYAVPRVITCTLVRASLLLGFFTICKNKKK